MNGILDDIRKKAEREGKTSVGDVIEAVGHRGYGPFLIVPSLFVLTPLGGIPGIPTFFALVTVLFAVQIALGRGHLWLPGMLRNRAVDSNRVKRSVEKARAVAERLDQWFHGRISKLTGEVGTRVAAACATVLCLTVPPLELLPFAAVAPMAAVAVLGLAILFDDGALMLAGYVVAAVGLALSVILA